jgi:hypothetical protein
MADQNPGIQRIQASQSSQSQALFLSKMPPIPAEVKQRFPAMVQWENDFNDWIKNANFNLRGAINPPPTTIN